MFELKPLVPIAFPSRNNGALLPALLSAALALMAGLQFAVPNDVDLTSKPGRVIARQLPERQPYRVVADPIILTDTLFSPKRVGKTSDVVSAPLGGAKAVGIVRGRGFRRVVMQDANGKPISISLGNLYQGWKLTHIGDEGVTFSRNQKRLQMRLGDGPVGTQAFQPSQQTDER